MALQFALGTVEAIQLRNNETANNNARDIVDSLTGAIRSNICKYNIIKSKGLQ